MAVIDLTEIRKSYGKGKKKVEVLHGINVHVEKGEIFGLLGKNGVGKTTLIKVMSGLLIPDTANGKVLGYDVLKESDKIRASVSLVAPTADIGADPVLTVRQNLLFWDTVYRIPSKKVNEDVNEIMEAAKMIRNFVVDLRNKFGITFFMTTHLIEEAEKICDRVMIIDEGNVKAVGTVDELRSAFNDGEEIVISGKFDILNVRKLERMWKMDVKRVDDEFQLDFHVENVDKELPLIIESVIKSGEIMNVETKRLTLNDVFKKAVI